MFCFSHFSQIRANSQRVRSLHLNKATQALQYLQLLVEYFNLCYSSIIYLAKIICIVLAAMGGFASVRLSQEGNFLFCLIYIILFVDGMTMYLGVFNSVFKLTEGVEDVKREIRLESTQLNGQAERREIRMRI